MTTPSVEDITYVADICNQIRANLRAETDRYNSATATFKPAMVRAGDAAIAALQRDLGLRATPSSVVGGGNRDSSSIGSADAAPALDQGDILRKMDRE